MRALKAGFDQHLVKPIDIDRLRALLTQQFAPTLLQIQDDSARHAGHAGAPAGGRLLRLGRQEDVFLPHHFPRLRLRLLRR